MAIPLALSHADTFPQPAGSRSCHAVSAEAPTAPGEDCVGTRARPTMAPVPAQQLDQERPEGWSDVQGSKLAAMLLRENRPEIEMAYLAEWIRSLSLSDELAEIWREAFPDDPTPPPLLFPR